MVVDFDSPESRKVVEVAEEFVASRYLLLENQVAEEDRLYKEQKQEAAFFGGIGAIVLGVTIATEQYMPPSHGVVGWLVGGAFAGAGLIHGAQNYLRHQKAQNQ